MYCANCRYGLDGDDDLDESESLSVYLLLKFGLQMEKMKITLSATQTAKWIPIKHPPFYLLLIKP